LLSTNPATTSQPPPRSSDDSRRVSDMLPSQPAGLFVVTSSHWTDISCAWFEWARSIFELDASKCQSCAPSSCPKAATPRLPHNSNHPRLDIHCEQVTRGYAGDGLSRRGRDCVNHGIGVNILGTITAENHLRQSTATQEKTRRISNLLYFCQILDLAI
jgi:hypothetical protein